MAQTATVRQRRSSVTGGTGEPVLIRLAARVGLTPRRLRHIMRTSVEFWRMPAWEALLLRVAVAVSVVLVMMLQVADAVCQFAQGLGVKCQMVRPTR
jgi:hypothetical protein